MAKLWSDAASPVRCPDCNGLAYLPAHETATLNGIVYPGCLVAFVAAFLGSSLVPLIVWGLLWIGSLGLFSWRAPMVAITEARAEQHKRYGNVFVALIAAAAAVWWFVLQD